MCGVFGYIGDQENAAELVLAGLKTLEYRGYDSWGVVVSPLAGETAPAQLMVKKRVGKIGDAGVAELPPSSLGLGHTRWATHGGVTEINSHPHLDCTGQIAVVHNGIIENYLELKNELLAAGHKFVSETDTEVAAHLIEAGLKSGLNLSEAVRLSFQKLTGQNALVVVKNEAGIGNVSSAKIVAVRQGSPLVLGLGKGENFVASDASALLAHTREVYYLEDGELAEISATGIIVKQVATGLNKDWQVQTLNLTAASVELGDFKHFLQKEIFEQVVVLENILKEDLAPVQKLAELIKTVDHVWLVACGSAGFAAAAGVEMLAAQAGVTATAVIASEFRSRLKLIGPKSLVIGLSQSGETMDVLNALKAAKSQGATIAALVNVVGSSLDRLAESSIHLNAGPELAVATTKAFTSKIAHLQLLTQSIANQPKVALDSIAEAISALKAVLGSQTYLKIQKLALSLQNQQHVFVIGKGVGVGAASEVALKLKETAYIHAEGLAAGELKHGSLALIEPGTPCIVLLSELETQPAILSAAMELKARGGRVIGIGAESQAVFDDFIQVQAAGTVSIIAQVAVGQILGYELALLKGIDPDKPRNLAKSVTVA